MAAFPQNVFVSENPAKALAESLVTEIQFQRRFFLGVSGGQTPRRLFEILANEYRQKCDWGAVSMYQVDERRVDANHDQSNWKMIRDVLLFALPEIHAYRIEVERPDAALVYEELLCETVPLSSKGIPELDCVLLGLGADGHTASLFPGSPACDEKMRLVTEAPAPAGSYPRVTMTFPILEQARKRLFLVSCTDKADALRRVFTGCDLPAARLAQVSTWFVDFAAAEKFKDG